LTGTEKARTLTSDYVSKYRQSSADFLLEQLPTIMELVTESRIEGECEGFDGDRVFELVNGQKWQQAIYKYK